MVTINKKIDEAVEIWRASHSPVALTGAGISVASGIPDFRSPKGLWEEFEPMEYATIEAFIHDPHKVWRMFQAVSQLMRTAQPNPAHIVLAELEKAHRLDAVITQNIDGLQQLAGSKNVIELHGTVRTLGCPECGYTEPMPATGVGAAPKACPRYTTTTHRQHRYLKPDVILFGEDIKREVFQAFIRWQNSMDLLIIIGTSAEVYPAAALPAAVRALGAQIIEINCEPTRITENITTCFLAGRAEEILPKLKAQLLK